MQVGNLYRNHRSLPGRAGYLLTLLSGIGLGYSGSPAVHVCGPASVSCGSVWCCFMWNPSLVHASFLLGEHT